MSGNHYQKLAEKLDRIPNGFPASESGVELSILEKIFDPQEAHLASLMDIKMASAEDIGGRAGMDTGTAQRLLKGMVRRGLIRIKRAKGGFIYGLRPFIVGIYEDHLPRMDEAFALLIERYFQEMHDAFYGEGPSVHRIIPVEQAIPFDLQIFPYEHARTIVENARSWGIRDCICRTQQRLIGRGCDHEIGNCLVFAPVENAFRRSNINRPITKEKSLRILREAAEAGLVHSTANHQHPLSYICNCCTCCCGILRGLTEFHIPAAVAKSDFHVLIDQDNCMGCGLCADRCPFGALSLVDDISTVDYGRCVGCGLCATVCGYEALTLVRRSEKKITRPPADIKEWMVRRAEKRNLAFDF